MWLAWSTWHGPWTPYTTSWRYMYIHVCPSLTHSLSLCHRPHGRHLKLHPPHLIAPPPPRPSLPLTFLSSSVAHALPLASAHCLPRPLTPCTMPCPWPRSHTYWTLPTASSTCLVSTGCQCWRCGRHVTSRPRPLPYYPSSHTHYPEVRGQPGNTQVDIETQCCCHVIVM